MERAKSNALPQWASDVVSDVSSLYAPNQASQTAEILAGMVWTTGLLGLARNIPFGLVAYRMTRGGRG
jgi:hypothetical protein